MKYILFVILFFWALVASSQSDEIPKNTKVIPTYIRVGQGEETTFCGQTLMRLEFDKKHLLLQTPQITLDLTIVVRSRDYWEGVTDNKQEYRITTIQIGDKYGMAVLPKSENLIGLYIHPTKELCE